MNGPLQNMGPSWYNALAPEFTKPYFTQLCTFVENERKNSKITVYPPPHQVYSWTNFFPIEQTKVVIIGQDPYHGPNQAHGLCFSMQTGVNIPLSLQNIYTELGNNYPPLPNISPGFIKPTHGNLTGWAQQGVLLLNSILTVRASPPNSHAGIGWETFTDTVVSLINYTTTGVVFILWGTYAKKKCAKIDQTKHLVLSSFHPSPLSAYKGFYNRQLFSQCNDYLTQQGKTPINWNHLPPL